MCIIKVKFQIIRTFYTLQKRWQVIARAAQTVPVANQPLA